MPGEEYYLEIAFGVWAIVVAYGVKILSALRSDVRNMSVELHKYIVKTETRLAVLEDRSNNNKAKS